MIRLAILAALTLVLAACDRPFEPRPSEQSDKIETPPKPQPNPDLSELSVQELIQTKYSRAQLVCRLWVQQGLELFTSREPNDVQTWDLITDFANEKTLFMKGSSKVEGATWSMETVIKLDVLKVAVEKTGTSTDYTPAIEMNIEYYFGIGTEKGRVYYAKGLSNMGRIREQETTPLLNTATTLNAADGSHFNYLECTIETERKPE